MLVVLKIPVVYLGIVVWWAIRAEPVADTGSGGGGGSLLPVAPCGWDDWKRRRPSRTRGWRPLRPGPRRAARRRMTLA